MFGQSESANKALAAGNAAGFIGFHLKEPWLRVFHSEKAFTFTQGI